MAGPEDAGEACWPEGHGEGCATSRTDPPGQGWREGVASLAREHGDRLGGAGCRERNEGKCPLASQLN